MGIYCDPAQPALAQFPTRDHSHFQWYSLLTDTCAINMNKLPLEFEPVVFIIDDFNLSHRLGVVLEAKVDKGSLLISTLNLGRGGRADIVTASDAQESVGPRGRRRFRAPPVALAQAVGRVVSFHEDSMAGSPGRSQACAGRPSVR